MEFTRVQFKNKTCIKGKDNVMTDALSQNSNNLKYFITTVFVCLNFAHASS